MNGIMDTPKKLIMRQRIIEIPDLYRACLVSPSRGEAWPRPMNQTTGPNLILLNPNTFAFVFVGPPGGCDIADRALERYRHQLLFSGCAAPGGFGGSQRRAPPRGFVGGVPVAVLNSLLVRLNGLCERVPHHDMDESSAAVCDDFSFTTVQCS
ncbi:hypothetical protein HPB52_019029 [Rhipicephalus sanguineus]|uniref:Uncharacterized protein n=1 Tax=Rhipicephalus sanguineus TaxID=34632 RepID=A0A9D4PKC1_RHISA|nr:hypothetical protein HPB52_019029 [Rhipicephalus sanguineus]